MKILCFTTSYNRPTHLYSTINNILSQSYDDINYSVNINIKHAIEIDSYKNLLNDFINDPRLKISFNKNNDQQTNYTKAIKGFNNNLDYDLFFKIDDDDIYHKHYIKDSIANYNDCDVLSYMCSDHINNNSIRGEMESIGQWDPDLSSNIKFGMPPTYIFNKKACDIVLNITPLQVRKIHRFEDNAWRHYWRNNNIKSKVIKSNLLTYVIHGQNTSSNKWLEIEHPVIDNEYVTIVWIKHKHWASYVYLNKRNQRVYNINNDDHGSFSINDNILTITWDAWGPEDFIKQNQKDSYFYVNKR